MTMKDNCKSILARAAIACAATSKEAAKLNEKRAGAYVLFPMAGMAAKDATEFEAAAESLFAEIRSTGKVSDGGKAHSLNCKVNKDKSGYLVPSAISSAKSVVLSAMTNGIALSEKGEARTFGEIRKDVQAVNAKEKRETAVGDERAMIDGQDSIAALSEALEGAKGAELARIVRELAATVDTVCGKVQAAKPAKTAKSQAVELAQAA
jgi:hypothetical protein